jgi:hypothetical protein
MVRLIAKDKSNEIRIYFTGIFIFIVSKIDINSGCLFEMQPEMMNWDVKKANFIVEIIRMFSYAVVVRCGNFISSSPLI